MHKLYSIPDILRMNDFTVEVAVNHRHFANQKGRYKKCTQRANQTVAED